MDSHETSGAVGSPFAVLGLEPRMTLKAADIERAYRAGVAGAHPDRLSGGGDDTGGTRIERIQDARRVLLNPELRAAALLGLLGGASAADDSSLPEGFLMEMLETRMEIEEAVAGSGQNGPGEVDPAVLDHWERWADEQRTGYIERVSALFESITGSEQDAADVLTEIRQELNAWRYIERLIEQLDPDYDAGRADFSDR